MMCATRLLMASTLSLLVVSWGPLSMAATCNVPTASYATIQSAIDDVDCTEIELAAQVFVESPSIARSLTLRGASSDTTVVQDRVRVTAGTVLLQGVTIGVRAPRQANPYPAALSVDGGAKLSGIDLVVLQAVPSQLFADGFESGDVSAWSGSVK